MNVFIIGAVAASVLWMFVIAWLLDSRAALRKELAAAQTALRLYRLSRVDQDALIAELFAQNDRLAHKLLDAKAAQVPIQLDQKALARCAAGAES